MVFCVPQEQMKNAWASCKVHLWARRFDKGPIQDGSTCKLLQPKLTKAIFARNFRLVLRLQLSSWLLVFRPASPTCPDLGGGALFNCPVVGRDDFNP
jgi:hypothetical protein